MVHNSSLLKMVSSNRGQHLLHRGATETPRHLRKFIKTVTMLLVAGLFCYLPFIITDLWTGWYTLYLKAESPRNLRFAYYMSTVPVFSYCPFNACLFMYRNETVKKYVRGKLRSRGRAKMRSRTECLSMRSVNQLGLFRIIGYESNEVSITPRTTPLLNRAVYVIRQEQK